MSIELKRPTPDPPARRTMGGRRGPVLKSLDDGQKKQMLEILFKGHGEHLACVLLGVSHRTLRNTFEWDESFRQDVRDAIEASREVVEKVAYDLARAGHKDFLLKALDRIDKARMMRQTRENYLAIKGGISERALSDLAYKVASHFAAHVPPEELPSLIRAIPGLIAEVSRRAENRGY